MQGPGTFSNIIANSVTIIGPTGSLYVYNPTEAFGNLVASIVGQGGTSPTGDTVLPGITVYGTASTYVQMVAGTPATINIGTGDPNQATPGTIDSQIDTVSAGRRILSTVIRAPRVTGQVVNSSSRLILESTWTDLSQTPVAVLQADDGTNQSSINLIGTQVTIQSGVSSAAISGGTTIIPPFGTGVVQSITDFSVHTAFSTTDSPLTTGYTIAANNAQAGTVYRIKASGFGTQAVTTAVNLITSFQAFGVNLGASQNAAAQMPAGTTFHWWFEAELIISATGVSGTCFASSIFNWTQAVTGGTNNTNSGGATNSTPITINTTISNPIEVVAHWASTTNNPTITGYKSTLERLGPLCPSRSAAGFTFTRARGILLGRYERTTRPVVSRGSRGR